MPNVVRNLFNTFTHTENKSAYTKKKSSTKKCDLNSNNTPGWPIDGQLTADLISTQYPKAPFEAEDPDFSSRFCFKIM